MSSTSSMQETLDQLLLFSNKAASINLSQGSIQLADSLISRKRTSLLRDAEYHENKLATICLGDSYLSR
jgi:hypothetical protein